MSVGINQANINMNAMTGLNSQFANYQINNELMRRLANPSKYSSPEAFQQEKQLMFSSIQNNFQKKCMEAMEPSLKKQQKKNIEKSYNYFA